MIQLDQLDSELKSSIAQARKKAANRIRQHPAKIAVQAVSLMDLTTLSSSDTPDTIRDLCKRAEQNPAGKAAAVCVYAQFVEQARDMLSPDIQVATVINFPDAILSPVEVETHVRQAIKNGVDELDVVFPYNKFKQGYTLRPAEIIRSAKRAAGRHKVKVIMESGSFNDPDKLYQASKIALENGADFLKTSTGKLPNGADLQAAAIMLKAIRDSGRKDAGIKVSGGIKTAEQAAEYIALAEEIMGPDWVTKDHFRIGASTLLDNLTELLQKNRHRPAPPQRMRPTGPTP